MRPEDIIDAFGTPEHPKSASVDKRAVLQWSESESIDVLGVLYGYLSEGSYFERVSPNLALEEYISLSLKYFERCLRDDPASKFANSRYEAGWELVALFAGIWNDESTPRTECKRIKVWLSELYRTSDENVRRCIRTATLEHLFEDARIANYFSDWKGDPLLGEAYVEAQEWSRGGGHSPLVPRPSKSD